MCVRVNTEEGIMVAGSGASEHETRHFASWTCYTLHRIPSNAIEVSGGYRPYLSWRYGASVRHVGQ